MADELAALKARMAAGRRSRQHAAERPAVDRASASGSADAAVDDARRGPSVEQQLAIMARDLNRDLGFKIRKLAGMERLGRLGTFVADLQGSSISFSEGAHDLVGLDAAVDPLSFRRYAQLVHPDDQDRVTAELKDIVAGVLELHMEHHGEHRLVRPDGVTRWVRSRTEAISDGDGDIDFVIGVLQDVTDEKRAAAQEVRNRRLIEVRVRELEQAQAELAQARDAAEAAGAVRARFLALMDGEMRTPLNSILGVLNVLDEARLDRAQAELVRSARRSGEDLRTTLNDMLDLSELAAGSLDLAPASFPLRGLLEDLERTWRSAAADNGLTLTTDFAGDLPLHLIGDRNRIRQILANFLANAVRMTTRGGVTLRAFVSTAAREADGWAELQFEVEDTGPGIAEQARERFAQAWIDPGNPGSGGLGLPIAHGLARCMDGDMGFRHAEYRGACFWVRLPLEVDRAHGEQATPDGASSLTAILGRTPRVLLAEDVPLNQMIARHLVESFGCIVEVVGDGAQALEALDSKTFDLVLMDVSMPVLDGIGATRRIRARTDAVAEVPVIAVTAYVLKEDVERLRVAGVDACVAKPLDPGELHEAMATVLTRHQIEHPSAETLGGEPIEPELGAATDEVTATPILQAAQSAGGGSAAPADGPVWDADGPLVDESMLDDLFRFLPGDAVQNMLDKLDDALEEVVRDAAAAVAAGDAHRLGRVVHSINGYAGNLGAMALTGLAKEIEHAARGGRGATAFTLARRLPSLVQDTLARFAEIKAQPRD